MNKKEQHLEDLRHLTLDRDKVVSYLLALSNLPGKRGNLELAFAFSEFIEEQYVVHPDLTLTFCQTLIIENSYDEQINGPEEFLPFCGVLGLGRIGKIDPSKESIVMVHVKTAAKDERWRIREAVAMAIQDLIDVRPHTTMALLESWIHEDNYLLQRAVVAGIAEPRFMKNRENAIIALKLHKTILVNVADETNRGGTNYKVLVKGLCYTLSVVIVGIEKEGFAFLEDLLTTENPIIHKIVRENLKKKRLVRLNAEKVVKLQQKLEKTIEDFKI